MALHGGSVTTPQCSMQGRLSDSNVGQHIIVSIFRIPIGSTADQILEEKTEDETVPETTFPMLIYTYRPYVAIIHHNQFIII